MSAFSAHGVVESQAQYADSIKGRGELTATDQGFEWTVRKLLSGQKDGARWKNVHMFGRQGHVLNVAYQFHYELGMKPFMAAVWFEGTLKDSEQVEAIARAHLSQSNWRAPYESEELGHWAAM